MTFTHRGSPSLLELLFERLEGGDLMAGLYDAGEEKAAQERVWARLQQDIESLHVGLTGQDSSPGPLDIPGQGAGSSPPAKPAPTHHCCDACAAGYDCLSAAENMGLIP